jgi:hypothetical protein
MGKTHRKDDNPANRDPITGAPGSRFADDVGSREVGGKSRVGPYRAGDAGRRRQGRSIVTGKPLTVWSPASHVCGVGLHFLILHFLIRTTRPPTALPSLAI